MYNYNYITYNMVIKKRLSSQAWLGQGQALGQEYMDNLLKNQSVKLRGNMSLGHRFVLGYLRR